MHPTFSHALPCTSTSLCETITNSVLPRKSRDYVQRWVCQALSHQDGTSAGIPGRQHGDLDPRRGRHAAIALPTEIELEMVSLSAGLIAETLARDLTPMSTRVLSARKTHFIVH